LAYWGVLDLKLKLKLKQIANAQMSIVGCPSHILAFIVKALNDMAMIAIIGLGRPNTGRKELYKNI
jgi:hypothetical protein